MSDEEKKLSRTLRLPMIETERCTGHCCKRFALESPEYLQRMYNDWHARGGPVKEEIGIIWPMLIHLGVSNLNSKGEVGEEGHFYTCKHFDTVTNGCMNYENRPRMCSAYPYGRECTFLGCTRKEEREQGPEQRMRHVSGIGSLPTAAEDPDST